MDAAVRAERQETDGLAPQAQSDLPKLSISACRGVDRKLRLLLKASGKQGVPQGGVISPLLSNLYLNEVDKMLEKAKETTRLGQRERVEYARFADDLVILVDSDPQKRQDNLPKLSISACGGVDRNDQSNPTRLGAILCGGPFESLLLDDPKLGGEEDPTPLGPSPTAPGLRMEAMEPTLAVPVVGTLR